MRSKSIFILSIFTLLFVAVISFAMADNDSSVSAPKNWTYNYSIPPPRNWTSICGRINESVSQKIYVFNDGKVRRINAYNNVESSIKNLIDTLKEKGADTTQAEIDYQTLQTEINQFNTDYSSFITKLEGLKVYSCGNSSGQFAQDLNNTKTFLPILRNDSIQVREAVMKVRFDLIEARRNLLISKLGQRENRTQANYQKRIFNLQNRTVRPGNITPNRIPNRIGMENRTLRPQNMS